MFKIKEENRQVVGVALMVGGVVGSCALAYGFALGHNAAMNSVRELVIASAFVDSMTEVVPSIVTAA